MGVIMVHINITMPEEMKERLDVESHREKAGRSTLIQRAVAFYIADKDRRDREGLLREGYVEMAGESAKLAKDFEFSDREALNHVD